MGHMVLCTHGILPVVLYVMEPIKGWKDFIVKQGLEVSSEGSLGRIGQGFGQDNEISL